ncbi:MAG: ComF family protein [Candidatus Aminicenantaceae bacterium]
MCGECWKLLQPEPSAHCLCCGRFYSGFVASHLCPACVETPPFFIRHRSACRYRGVAKELILLFKYQKMRVLGKDLARFLYSSLKDEEGLWWEAEALVPVPLHPHRYKQRGFNQAEYLAQELSALSGIQLHKNCLVKRRDALPQTSLTGESRRENLRGAFAVKDRLAFSNKVVVLVDDVFTTGSTLQECSRTLIEAGAREVRAVTLAQA